MDNVIKTKDQPPPAPNGIFVRGVVVSSTAKAIRRKDGSGIAVIVSNEIATRPGVTVWEQFYDPKTDRSVRVEGDKVVEYPKLKEFEQVTVKALRVRSDEHTGQLIIRTGELVL
jgi:hypothetical protein